ncbi:CAP domain-containing protein [Terrisporobacter vanillatitrophus]|uniref:CAP domain-containing protein n=1 Tax=Terrisporobacter vanillatitrophus TaxID=3058402 RepID=UPI003368CFAF
MNKKFKTLLTAGLITVMAGSSIVSSSALCKKAIDDYKTKGAIYLNINGKNYKIPLGLNNKPSQEKDSSTEKNNANTGNNNSQSNNNTNTGNNNSQSNNNTNTNTENNNNQSKNNTNTENNNNQSNNNTNTGNNNNTKDNVAEKPSTDNSTSNNNQSTTESFSSFQKEVTRLVNVERSKRGLSELSFNTQLSNVATLKSQDMINKNYFSHTSPTYGSPFDMMKQFNISYRTAGENIAMGQKTPAEVVNAWMNSQGHRENILNSNFTDIGVGVAKSSNGTLYWTQMFIGK